MLHELGVEGVGCGVEVGVQVLPSVLVNRDHGISPWHYALGLQGLQPLLHEEHAVVDLPEHRLRAVEGAQQLHQRHRDVENEAERLPKALVIQYYVPRYLTNAGIELLIIGSI